METLLSPDRIFHESNLLQTARDLGPKISKNVEEEENSGKLSAETVGALRSAGFYKLFLPKSLGGLEADPVTVAKLVEEVARYNTAAGWSLMVANTTIFMTGFLPEEGIDEIFRGPPEAFVAGSIHPPMRATAGDNGYIINGRNQLVSNVHEANWITVSALVMDGEQPKITDGHPELIIVMMKRDDCRIIDTWQPFGMRATDSNDVEAKDVFVPNRRLFHLGMGYPTGKHFQGPLFRFPAAGANICCLLAPVSLAVAQNAIDELKTVADKKRPLGSMVTIRERGVVQAKLAKAVALVRSSRIYLHETLADTWTRVLGGETISLEEKAGLLLAAAHANQSCVQAVELIYSAAGTTGIYLRNKLAHYFTDAQVLRQHGFMNESRYETAGQVFFGFPPDLPLIQL